MSDDTTEALNRIANALELQALVSAYQAYKNGVDEYVSAANAQEDEKLRQTAMEWANRNHQRAIHASDRIDQLTGYKEDK